MTDEHKKNILDRVAKQVTDEVFNPDFSIEDVVEFAACPGILFEIVGGESPFWELKHFGGPPMPSNYHKACFGEDPPHMQPVIETVLVHSNPMEVLAIMASD